jgi:hypothetical protein
MVVWMSAWAASSMMVLGSSPRRSRSKGFADHLDTARKVTRSTNPHHHAQNQTTITYKKVVVLSASTSLSTGETIYTFHNHGYQGVTMAVPD